MLSSRQLLFSASSQFYLHFRVNIIIEVLCFAGIALINICAELIVANFVSFFILSVIWQIFLNCVIGEMDAASVLSESVLARSCPNVAVLVPIPFDDTIDTSHHNVMPQIKLTLVVKQRSLNVSLYNKGPIATIIIFLTLLYNGFYLIKS